MPLQFFFILFANARTLEAYVDFLRSVCLTYGLCIIAHEYLRYRNTQSTKKRMRNACHRRLCADHFGIACIEHIIRSSAIHRTEFPPSPRWPQAVPPPADTAGGGRGESAGGAARTAPPPPAPPRGAGGGAGGAAPTPPTPPPPRLLVRVLAPPRRRMRNASQRRRLCADSFGIA